MVTSFYTPLQMREIFHLEFLRWFGRKTRADRYSLKGGVNLRLFYGSIRYSEDMDIDVQRLSVVDVREITMGILGAGAFAVSLEPFGVKAVVPPDMAKAKQTDTTQRFKIHLLTGAGDDLFTKIEFSRREAHGAVVASPVPSSVTRAYKIMPVIVPHYDAVSAFCQKVGALAGRSVTQARDIFDLYLLSSLVGAMDVAPAALSAPVLAKACENVFAVEYDEFQGAVVTYLSEDDRQVYERRAIWDELKLKVSDLLEAIRKRYDS